MSCETRGVESSAPDRVLSRYPMPEIYGVKRHFNDRHTAENFARQLTRELTAGGIAHWIEVRETRPARWVAHVHAFACPGGASCTCGSDDAT